MAVIARMSDKSEQTKEAERDQISSVSGKLSRMVSFTDTTEKPGNQAVSSSSGSDYLSRNASRSSDEVMAPGKSVKAGEVAVDEDDETAEEVDELDEEYEEDEEDEEDDEADVDPTSQYISALDLAGFG
jgi:hypothetical protein